MLRGAAGFAFRPARQILVRRRRIGDLRALDVPAILPGLVPGLAVVLWRVVAHIGFPFAIGTGERRDRSWVSARKGQGDRAEV